MGFHSSPGGARESNALLLRVRLTGIPTACVCTFAKGEFYAQLETQSVIFRWKLNVKKPEIQP